MKKDFTHDFKSDFIRHCPCSGTRTKTTKRTPPVSKNIALKAQKQLQKTNDSYMKYFIKTTYDDSSSTKEQHEIPFIGTPIVMK